MLASEKARLRVRKSVDCRDALCLYKTNITKVLPNQESHPRGEQIEIHEG